MRILSRYVFRQAAGALVLILLSLTAVVWIAVALRQLELMTNQGQDAVRFLIMTTLAIPSMLALIAPIALLIAAIHVLNRLNGDSELIVMTAGGARTWALLKPLGLLALLVALGVAAVNHIAGPWSQKTLREFVVLVRTDLMAQVIQPWRFTTPEQKLTIHIRDRAPNGDLLGLLLHDAREPKRVVSYLAERGTIIKQEGSAFLRMTNGHIVRRLEEQKNPQIIVFSGYTIDLKQLEARSDQSGGNFVRPRERSTPELWRPDPEDPLFKANPGGFRSELHERLSSPLYAFAFALVVLAFIGRAQTTRQSRIKAVVSAFVVGACLRILGIAAANAAAGRPAMVVVLYAIPVGAGLLAAIALQLQMYPRPPSRLSRSLAGLLDRSTATVAARASALAGARPARSQRA
jgi:lipopolysaccharide export system permease protein